MPSEEPQELYRVTAPTYVAGFVVRRGKVVNCAPIIRKMVMGKPVGDVLAFFQQKRIRVEKVEA